ncbi:MAG: DUF1456 family protein [Bacteriovoracaceae bacterium]|nr:DUF1456 family protein [Bacteriovoracaceae bacterium]
MTNNDVLRRVRYLLNYNDTQMIEVFGLAEFYVNKEELNQWLKKDDDPEYKSCSAIVLASFLNGLIIQKRGKKDGEIPKPETSLNNNIVLRKLMIAFNLKAEDVVEMFELADLRVSKHELSAFFRKAGHKNYRECKDQFLRNFMNGLLLKLKAQKNPEGETK